MRKLKVFFAASVMGIFPHEASFADDGRKHNWYVTTGDEYAVMESLRGNFFAKLYEAQDGKPNVYFETHSPEHCRKNGERTISHDPIYVNGTLVRISQHCRGEWNLFFASSQAGRDHVINQFRRSRSVTLSYSGIDFIFSAMGFIDRYNSLNNRINAL